MSYLQSPRFRRRNHLARDFRVPRPPGSHTHPQTPGASSPRAPPLVLPITQPTVRQPQLLSQFPNAQLHGHVGARDTPSANQPPRN